MKQVILSIVLLLLTVAVAEAALPKTISYQGVFKDENGNPVGDNDYQLICRIYDVASGGSPLWQETHTIETQNGIFSVTLGSDTTLDLDFDVPYWLGISFDGLPEMSQRVELASSPYAFRAAVAEAIEGGIPADNDWVISGDDMHAGVSGNVGIGVAAPLGKLHVAGVEDTDLVIFNVGGADRFSIQAHGTGPDYLAIRTKFENPETDVVVFRGDGNVGIGTTSPNHTLEVNGDTHVAGQLSWAPKTSYLSIPSSAFTPQSGNYQTALYIESGTRMGPSAGDPETQFFAPVSLPHGSTLTRVTLYYLDATGSYDATLTLNRNNMDITYTTMSTISTSGNSGVVESRSDDTINPPGIDNSQYCYYLEWDTQFAIFIVGVIIEYSFAEPS